MPSIGHEDLPSPEHRFRRSRLLSAMQNFQVLFPFWVDNGWITQEFIKETDQHRAGDRAVVRNQLASNRHDPQRIRWHRDPTMPERDPGFLEHLGPARARLAFPLPRLLCLPRIDGLAQPLALDRRARAIP